jgi:hypothetical protein
VLKTLEADIFGASAKHKQAINNTLVAKWHDAADIYWGLRQFGLVAAQE